MITSRQNQWVKDMRALRRSKGDRALLEGPHLVAEALDLGLTTECILATPSFLETSDGIAFAEEYSQVELTLVAENVLASVADADTPRGLAAIASLPTTQLRDVPRQAGGIYLYLDAMQDPGNLGALARVAEAAGAMSLLLGPGSVHPNHPRALRASAGSLLRLPTARDVEPEELAEHLEALSPEWLALIPRGGTSPYDLPARQDRAVVLVLGGEGPGVGERVLKLAETTVTLPMKAPVESLNITVAAALLLYELAHRRD